MPRETCNTPTSIPRNPFVPFINYQYDPATSKRKRESDESERPLKRTKTSSDRKIDSWLMPPPRPRKHRKFVSSKKQEKLVNQLEKFGENERRLAANLNLLESTSEHVWEAMRGFLFIRSSGFMSCHEANLICVTSFDTLPPFTEC
jgi:hypothetical protein